MNKKEHCRSANQIPKYKTSVIREQMINDHFSRNKNPKNTESESSSSSFMNECPGGDSCVNLERIQRLLAQIQKLKTTNDDVTKLNNFFVLALNRKDTMYRSLFVEHNNIKRDSSRPKEISFYSPSNQIKDHSTNLAPITDRTKKSPLVSSMNKNSKLNKSESKFRIPQSSSQIISMFRKEQKKKKETTSILNSIHYDEVAKLSDKTSKQKFQSSVISFFSMTNDQLKEVENSENMEFIKSLTQSEEYFVSILRSGQKEFLINFNESLRTLIKEYRQIINLIIRIKEFHKSTVEFVSTLFSTNSTEILLENTCKLLDCEKTRLFIYEPISDMLQVFSSGLYKKGPSKISKNRGIIGISYLKGEKIKIEDATSDIRFKKEDELKDKRNKTRNLMCYPLIDRDGSTFGVFQVINKREKFFNNDDDEFMTILSKLASVILNNKINNDNDVRQIERLEKIVKYSNDIRGIQERDKLMEKTENVLMSLFCSSRAQFIFVVEGELFHYNKQFMKGDNIGIINFVIKKKECHGCCRARRCKYYNTLIDIEASDSLITYPILYNNECLGVAQVSLPERISEVTLKPKDQEMKLLSLIESCIIEWYLDNKDDSTKTDINIDIPIEV